MCCFGHVNGVQLTQVQWKVNAVFGLCRHRRFFKVCFSVTTFLSNRIATLTKMQHKYCIRFTEEILSVTPRLLAPTVGTVGFSRLQGNEVRCMSALLSSSYKFWICSQFSLNLFILFLREIIFKCNLKMKECFLPFWPTDVSPVSWW